MAFLWRNASGQELFRLGPDNIARWGGAASSYTEIGSNESGQYIRQLHKSGTTALYIRGYTVNGVQAEFRSGGITVAGTVKSEEVLVVPDAWADHVFDDDYRLLSLVEVQSYINTHGRLPGIPSEAEVLDEGVRLGEMNAKLLEKIEELTLYLLQQEEKIEQLQEQVNNDSSR